MSVETALEATPLRELLKRYWGYDDFRPLQAEAVASVVERQDSLVILPTGGGKSLCYQLPALAMPGMAIVISPLISLIKDQVDGLRANGIEAAALNSAMASDERKATWTAIREGRVKLLYLAPEALMTAGGEPNEGLFDTLRQVQLSFIAIDEAHCISQWGHEYRPAYRGLGALRQWFPQVALHAFTATATEAVRDDIARNLGMREPQVLVGSFDRPNLTYRTVYRRDLMTQVREVLTRHAGEAGVIYCISKAEVDTLSEALVKEGYRALPYHAGLGAETRAANQEAFSTEAVDVIVATVAFGMGIDRSNVRFVLHAGMPKSIENYQQEAGRAGRDGLPAECVLLYGAGDAMTWRRIQGEAHGEYGRAAMRRINEMYTFCQAFTCRHRFLVGYFGQDYGHENCGACDFCLGEKEALPDSTSVARTLLEGVAAVRERFGAGYVAQVLKGSKVAKIASNRHDQLAQYGVLADRELGDLSDWLDQLVGQGLLERGDFQVLQLTEAGRGMLEGEGEAFLTKPRPTKKGSKSAATARAGALEGPEEELFQALRRWRRELALERGVPPYVIFSDDTLQGLARSRPTNTAQLLDVKGIGQTKAADLGERLLAFLASYCDEHGLSRGQSAPPQPAPAPARPAPAVQAAPVASPAPAEKPASGRAKGATQQTTLDLFREGLTPGEIAEARGLAESTVLGHLAACVEDGRLLLDEVVSPEMQLAITPALELLGSNEAVTALMFLVPAEVDFGHIQCVLADCRYAGRHVEPIDDDLSARLRWLAGLAKVPAPEEREALLGELYEEEPRVRALAALAVAKMLPTEAGGVLVPALARERDPLALAGLIRGLGMARDAAALAPLTRLLEEGDWDQATRAIAQRVVTRLAALDGASEAPPQARAATVPAAEPPRPAATAPEKPPVVEAPSPTAVALEAVLGRLADLPGAEDADMLLGAIAELLEELGYRWHADYPVADRGDGRAGRVALVAEGQGLKLAFEVNGKLPSYRSLYKLGQVPGAYRVLVLQDTPFAHLPEFADALVVLGSSPRLLKR